MKKIISLFALCLLFCIAGFSQKDVSVQFNGTDSIQQTLQRFIDAWNIHDAKAFSMQFAEDADFTNVFGKSSKGRLEIEKFHTPLFSTIFKSSRQTIEDKKIRFIKPDVAAVDVWWGMTGATYPDGKPWADRKGLLNFIMMPQKNGTWVIVVMHNMDLPQIPPK